MTLPHSRKLPDAPRSGSVEWDLFTGSDDDIFAKEE